MTDAVTLTVPYARPYYGVVRLVVGGLASRLDLPYEQLEDVQIGLESLVTNEAYAAGGEVTVEVAVQESALELTVGPLDAARLERDLAADVEASRGVDLRRLLTTVMGGFDVERRADGGDWVRMTKEIAGPGVAATP